MWHQISTNPHFSYKQRNFFVYNIKETYYKKSNPIYGIFGDGDRTFRSLLTEYINNKLTFLEFTQRTTEYYKVRISQISPATGGHIPYVHFANDNDKQEYLLVLTTNNKDGYVIDEDNLTIKDIKNLDLNKINIACLINLSRWYKISQGLKTDSKTYLSFVRGNKNISQYFMSFIDCNNNNTSSESTKRLVKALDKYWTTSFQLCQWLTQ